ncbi:MAG: hypothetical protein ACREF6_00730, partial [Alphaproteobacteria bacterium]
MARRIQRTDGAGVPGRPIVLVAVLVALGGNPAKLPHLSAHTASMTSPQTLLISLTLLSAL